MKVLLINGSRREKGCTNMALTKISEILQQEGIETEFLHIGVAKNDLAFKPAAAIASARRAGTSTTLDVLNKYFMINQMPVVSSCYWNMVHGSAPEEVLQDKEGVQIMETLGRNMAWLLKSIEAGKKAGVKQPEPVDKVMTNFIR